MGGPSASNSPSALSAQALRKRKFQEYQTLFVRYTRVIQFKVESEPFLTKRLSTVFRPTTGFVFPLQPELNNIGSNLHRIKQSRL